MKLRRRIARAALSDAARVRLLQLLDQVAQADGQAGQAEDKLIDRLLPGARELTVEPAAVEPAAVDALWPHKELVLTACIYVAVSDGEYQVEEARLISRLAHQLGLSAHQLGELEERTFAELAARAQP